MSLTGCSHAGRMRKLGKKVYLRSGIVGINGAIVLLIRLGF